MSYQTLLTIRDKKFSDKSVLIIGAGWMARQYCAALKCFDISNVNIISRSEHSSAECAKEFGYKGLYGGYSEKLSELPAADLTIIATPVHELRPAADRAVECGQKNILVEKPGSLYSSELKDWESKTCDTDVRIRIAHNRLVYPSFWKLKSLCAEDGGILSCRYTFTELIRGINFQKEKQEVYQRWGIANSLHVIGMAHALIGMPKILSDYRIGGLSWHPTASRFTGAGITEKDILFSYHADWDSAGRWGIEIMTPENAYRMIPLEKLFRCARGSFDWGPVEVETLFPRVKEGIAEEVAVMLDPELEKSIPLVTLAEAVKLVNWSERMLGYGGCCV